jgi:hypothetical protein
MMTPEPPNLATCAELARRLNIVPLTLRRKIRGKIEPAAFLLTGRRAPHPLYKIEDLQTIRRTLLSTEPPTTI